MNRSTSAVRERKGVVMASVWSCALATAVMAGSTPTLQQAVPRTDQVTIGHAEYHRYEWRASTYSSSTQDEAALGMAPGGGIFVVWSSRKQQDGRYGVYGQWFDARGVPAGGETCLNLWTASHQRSPAVACDAPGRAWVVWQSHGQDGHAGSIIARRFDPSGRSEIIVNERSHTHTTGHETVPVVAASRDGRALIAWTTAMPGTSPQVRARLIGADAALLSDELQVSADPRIPARGPAVAAGVGPAAGDFAIVYAIADELQRPAGIRLRLYDATSNRLGEPVDIGSPEATAAIEPVITATAGGYVAAWLEPARPGHVVVARRLDARGCPVGDSFVTAAVPGPQSGVTIAAATDGRFAVAFNAPDGDGLGIFARVFAADGTPAGESFRLNRYTTDRQSLRAAAGTVRLAFAGNGSLVCAWSGDGGFGDRSSVNVTALSPVPFPAAQRGVTGMLDAGAIADASVARPHEPPTFDPGRVADAQRDVVVGPQGIGFTGIVDTGWTPPDPHMAVGPEHLVLMTNGAIAFFTKDGTQTFQDQIAGPNGFWGELGATGSVFDPEALYDPLSGRFFVMAAEFSVPPPPAGSRALLAVSDDADPNGTWHKYRFDTSELSGGAFDSPNMSVDDQALYLTGDGLGVEPNYPVYVFDKASLLAGDPPSVANSLTIPTLTQSAGIPPVSFDAPPALYMIEHEETPASTTVRLIALQDPLGSPSFVETTLDVAAYDPPRCAPQQGTSVTLLTFDARFWSVAYRNGSLWAAHHVNGDRVLARWYEIAMNGWPDSGVQPALVQSGEIDPGPGVNTFHAAITVDDHGNAAMTFSRSAADEFVSMATAYRYASDPPGTFRPSVIRRTNTGPYTIGRWGDYGAVNVDPVNGLTMWANPEYAENNSWRTWVEGFTPVFDPADLDFDGAVGIQDFLILLGQWGPCAPPCPPACTGDIDGDCNVGITDFLILLGNWG